MNIINSIKSSKALLKSRQYAPWLFVPVSSYYQQWIKPQDRQKIALYARLMRLDKPIGTYLLLWPTLWALWLATQGAPSLFHLVIFSLGVFLMRSAGCVINDYADRDFDGKVKRTQARPLATKAISDKEALILFAALSFSAFCLVLTLNALTIYLSFGALAIAICYPFMKRYTYFPQVVLGAAFAWSIPMGFAATTHQVPSDAWLLYLCTLLWVLAYDTFYGMVDRKDDIKVGIKSTAILFGEADLAITGFIQSLFMFGMLLVGSRFELGAYYYISWVIAAALIGYQFWLARKRKPEQCFKAFLNNNYVGMVLFLGMVLDAIFST